MKPLTIFSAIGVFLLTTGPVFAELSLKLAIDNGVTTERGLEQDLETLKTKLNELLEAKSQNKEIIKDLVEINNDCVATPEKPIVVCILTDGSDKTDVKFISPSEVSNLAMDHIDFSDSELDLEQYVTSFVEHIENLVSNDKDKYKLIFDTINGITSIEKQDHIKIVPDSGNKAEETKGKVVITLNEQDYNIDYEWAENTLTFRTNFFENAVTLTMFEKTLIASETKRVFEEVVRHFERMKRFALSESSETVETVKILDCSKIISENTLKSFENILGTKGTISNKDDATYEYDVKYNDHDIKITCNPNIDVGIELLSVKMSLGSGIHDLELPIPKNSLYSLDVVAESFFEDGATLSSRIFVKPQAE